MSAPVSQHITQCAPDTPFPAAKILDKCQSPSKLLTFEALYIDRLAPALNQRDEFWQRHLTLKV